MYLIGSKSYDKQGRHCETDPSSGEAILMRSIVAMVVRLLPRLKKPPRNDDRNNLVLASR
jgi:hypothetical protein